MVLLNPRSANAISLFEVCYDKLLERLELSLRFLNAKSLCDVDIDTLLIPAYSARQLEKD
jgi:hypothetical protein